MHIIKISPDSFKVILSKSDMEKYGSASFDGSDNSKKMLNHILSLLKNKDKSCAGGITHAEFFEDKFGGGELFLRLSPNTGKAARYIFSSKSIESIIEASKVIASKYGNVSSRLFCFDGFYRLLVFSKIPLPMITSRLGEFGQCRKAEKSDIWLTEEHGTVLIPCRAVEKVIEFFKG